MYYCNAINQLNIDSPDRSNIDSITGKHLPNMTIDDVIGFEADNLTIRYFPQGLEKIFKNLQMIDINNGRLKEVHQSDLKPFPKLKCLELFDNDIEILEEGLFDFNPELEMIWLTDNKILHVDVNVFDKLVKLTHLSLDQNHCISEYTDNNATAVAEIVRETKIRCKDMRYLEKVYPVFMKEFMRMKKDIEELTNQLGGKSAQKQIQDEKNGSFGTSFVILMLVGTLFGAVGFVIYRKFYTGIDVKNARVAFENHEYS